MSLKIEFVERADKGEKVAPLCREFGISRTTGHKWLKRFRELGYEGLEEESRRPRSTPLATAEDLVLAVLEARDAHPRWGPKKLAVVLRRRFKELTPSERTIARILKRAHRVRERKRRGPKSVIAAAPVVSAAAPNDVWTVDFKGWWLAANRQRCEPLTVRDAFSRYVLASTLCHLTIAETRPIFERLFKRHGVPYTIQCDNGPPFISVMARGGLTTLSAWWVSLGIQLARSRPGCPQDNGGPERMHRDIRTDIQASPGANPLSEQRRLDRWRQEFNHVRPHQALEGKTPAQLYVPADRRRPNPREPRYSPELPIARVARNGAVSYQGARYYLSQSLAGHIVALELVDPLHVRLWFHELDLGLLEVEPTVDIALFEMARTTNRKKTTKRDIRLQASPD